MKKIIYLSIILAFASGCNETNDRADAYGNFETTEITVSAEGNGKLVSLKVEEGDRLKKGQLVGVIDTLQLHYQKQVLNAQRAAVSSKTTNVVAQRDVYTTLLSRLNSEVERFKKLVADKAATQKQLDDLESEVDIAKSKIKSIESQNLPVISEIKAMDAQILQLNDLIAKSKIVNPIDGLVTTKLAEESEMITMGKPVYKVADMSTMILRVYISGDQLPVVKVGQQVEVLIDKDKTENTIHKGKISWISDVAEFTPKIIQTKKDRVNQVYAVKVRVKNDGSLKIGMPGEVNFK